MSTAVMARRVEAPNSLDFFPTPPWATRALVECVLRDVAALGTAWEPAAGEGHMAEVLREYFDDVHCSDVHDYGKGYEIGSFTGVGIDVVPSCAVDWVITNPPFNRAAEFVERAMCEAGIGVAMLLRTSWLEGGQRWTEVFSRRPPSIVAVFSERVPMVKGRFDPNASSATSYSWFIWLAPYGHDATRLVWVPPGQCNRLTRPDDALKFAKQESGEQLDMLGAQ